MKKTIILLAMALFCSCEGKVYDKDLDLLAGDKWIQISPENRIPVWWSEEDPEVIFTHDNTITFNPNGNYIRELYYNTAPRFEQTKVQFLQMSGRWNKKADTIYLLPARIFKIDDMAIKDDSLFFIYENPGTGSRFCNKELYNGLINRSDLTEKWFLTFISSDSLIIRSIIEYKFIRSE